MTSPHRQHSVVLLSANTSDRPDNSHPGVLETLRRVERKLDTLSLTPGDHHHADTVAHEKQGIPFLPDASKDNSREAGYYASPMLQQSLLARLQKTSEQLTVPHKILLWPSIYADVVASQTAMALDMQSILREGVHWFARAEARKQPPTLPAGIALPSFAINNSGRPSGSSPNIMFPTLLPEQVHQSSAAYFDTFNLLYPVLDREKFTTNIQDTVLSQGYTDGDAADVLLLLVFALGQVSIEGAQGAPISTIDGHPSGFRGGSVVHPPGLAAFNEARRRFGFIAMECSLETVQILLLQMIYVESHGRHIEFWRLATAASMAFHGLINTQVIDWTSNYGHEVKCVYWTCTMNEGFYHLDLDLAETGIVNLENDVPLPDFSRHPRGEQRTVPTVSWVFHAQFLALIALRSITMRIHDAVQTAEGSYALTQSVYGSALNHISSDCHTSEYYL